MGLHCIFFFVWYWGKCQFYLSIPLNPEQWVKVLAAALPFRQIQFVSPTVQFTLQGFFFLIFTSSLHDLFFSHLPSHGFFVFCFFPNHPPPPPNITFLMVCHLLSGGLLPFISYSMLSCGIPHVKYPTSNLYFFSIHTSLSNPFCHCSPVYLILRVTLFL